MRYFLLILLFLFTSCRYSATTNNIPLIRVLLGLMETTAGTEMKDLTAFSFPAQSATGTITGTSISVTVPVGTSVTALVATFTTTGANVKVGSTVQVSGTTANDFTSPVMYTVTASDGSTQDYVVTVSVAAAPATSSWDNTNRPRITTWDASSFTTSWGTLSTAVSYKIYYWTTVWNSEQSATSTSVVFTTNINSARKICAVNSGAVEFQCLVVYPVYRSAYPDMPAHEISGTYSDDFNDGVIGSAYAQIQPTQMAEASGYFQLNQNITNGGPGLGLYYNRGNYRYMRITCKWLAHRNGNEFSGSLTLVEPTHGLQTIYHGMWYSDYNPSYGWTRSITQYSDNFVFSQTPITILSSTQIFDTWMDVELIIDFTTATVTSRINGTLYSSASIRADWGDKVAIHFSPYGWFTGHYIRIDDLSIQSQDAAFP